MLTVAICQTFNGGRDLVDGTDDHPYLRAILEAGTVVKYYETMTLWDDRPDIFQRLIVRAYGVDA